MKKEVIVLILIVIALLGFFRSQAQTNIRETVFSHVTSHDLIVGETLYYTSYVFSVQTGRLSNLSRLLYIELLDQSGRAVHQSKIQLNDGTGSGKYYLPTSLETGNYHFVAYTRWMQNFGDFFHQKIEIINPYLSPSAQPEEESVLHAEVVVEGGQFLANSKNKLVLKVTDQFDTGQEVTGKIISKSDDFSLKIQTDKFGFFSFYLNPKVNESFQLILNHGDRFEFFDLPRVDEGGISMRIVETGDLFVVSVKTKDAEDFTQGQLEFLSANESIFSQAMAFNTSVSVEKKILPDGLLNVTFTSGGDLENDRIIWKGPSLVTRSSFLGKYSPAESVEASFEIVDSAFLSISVEQVEERDQLAGINVASHLGNKVKLDLPFEFYQKTDVQEKLNDALMFVRSMDSSDIPAEVSKLPEYRYGIVQGQVRGENDEPKSGISVGLIFSGEQPQLSVTKTDSKGDFMLTYEPKYSTGDSYVAALDGNDVLSIFVESEFYSSYNRFINEPVRLDSSRIASIVKRSINNQIENAYHQEEVSISEASATAQFDHVKSYRLADYTRFSTLRDTFIEFIPEVGVSKNENKYEFRLRSQDPPYELFNELPTLLLLDGAFVDAEVIMKLSPYLIDRIDVLNKRYYFGSIIFDGIISFHTISKDRGEASVKGTKLALSKIQDTKAQGILSPNPMHSPRRPKFEDLLYWNPLIEHRGGELNFSFFTSEVTGLFEIRVEGVSTTGTPISKRAYFEVR